MLVGFRLFHSLKIIRIIVYSYFIVIMSDIILNQWRDWTCANYAVMGVLSHKWIKYDLESLNDFNGLTYPIVEKLFKDRGLIKKFVPIPTPRLVDIWLKKWDWLITKTSTWNFKNPPNVTFDGTSHHFFIIKEDCGDRWKCQNSWGKGWGEGGCFYINKSDFKSLFIPRRIIT